MVPGYNATKGALVGQTSVKLSSNETSSANSASLKELVNDATNKVIVELYANQLLEQVNAGVVYGGGAQSGGSGAGTWFNSRSNFFVVFCLIIAQKPLEFFGLKR